MTPENKNPLGRAAQGENDATCIKASTNGATSQLDVVEIFQELAALPRWVPFKLSYNADRQKFDKIPHTGRHGLSTAKPDNWFTLLDAGRMKNDNSLPGVGLVMTGHIDVGDWILLGFDFDDVDFEHFTLPYDTYAERSPSGAGVRSFVWVPRTWAEDYKDTTDARYPGCSHLELYVGSSPRFLTVTFDAISLKEIAFIEGADLAKLECLLHRADPTPAATVPTDIPDGGNPINFALCELNGDQRHLINGTGNLDRSAVLHGLLIRLIDDGASQEDLLATLLTTPALWKFCLEHRRHDEGKAREFAKQEVARAYGKSLRGKQEALAPYNESWKPTLNPEGGHVPFPKPRPGYMAETVAAIERASPKVQNDLAILAVLAAMASICGTNYALPGGGGLNLYCCNIAKTGAGKDKGLKAAKLLAKQVRVKLIGKAASGQGLEDALTEHAGMLAEIDEIAHVFAAMNARQAPAHLVELNGILLRLFNASDDVYNCRLRADQKPRTVNRPALSLVGTATPERLGEALTTSNIAEGLLNRFLFARGQDSAEPRRVHAKLVLPNSIKAAAIGVDMVKLKNDGASPIDITITPEAEGALDMLLMEFHRGSQTAASSFTEALLVRSYEIAERVAGVLAVWDKPAAPSITVEHVEWAAAAVRASNAAVSRFVEKHLSGDQEQRDAAKLLEVISRITKGELKRRYPWEDEAAAGGWVSNATLLKHARMDSKRFHSALHYLLEVGDVEQATHKHEHANGRIEEPFVVHVMGE